MKVPFRLQATEYDCVPASLVNALCYLFDREQIPPSVIQRIYLHSLDRETLWGESRRGTSGYAVEMLGGMLNNYREKRYKHFAVHSEFITGCDVHLKKDGKVLRCLDSGGVALLRVWLDHDDWHYILAFRHEDGHMQCFDSYRPSKKAGGNDAVLILDPAGHQEHNLAIPFTYLDQEVKAPTVFEASKHQWALGPKNERECLLLSGY